MKRKIFLTLFILLFISAVGVAVRTEAGTEHNTSGWLWGGSEETADGAINGNETGVGWVSMNNTTPGAGGSVSYGVNIPSADGNLSGYGWSENVGWLSFNAADVSSCPSGTCSARRVGNNLEGWARIVGIKNALAAGNSGDWQGWVKLKGTNYGVTINANGTLLGYAWSDELGWLDFKRASTIPVIPKVLNITLTVVPDTCVSCSSLTSTLTATRESTSTTIGNLTYEFDCTNDGTIDGTYNTSNTSQNHNCTYTGTSTASVKVTQEGVTRTATKIITFISSVCGNEIREGIEECDEGANNDPCPARCSEDCKWNSCGGNWIEVAP